MLYLVFQSQLGNSLSCLKSSFIPHGFLQIIISNYSYLNKIYTFDNELTTSNRWFLHLENTLVKWLLSSPPFPLTHCRQCWLSFTYLIILCLNSFLIFRVKYIFNKLLSFSGLQQYQENHEIRESLHFKFMSYLKSLEIDTIFSFKSKNLKIFFFIIILIYLNQRSISTPLIL